MDGNQENEIDKSQQAQQEEVSSPSSSSSVSFPSIPAAGEQKSKKGLIILAVSILLILGVVGFFVFNSMQSSSSDASPTPFPTVEGISSTPTSSPTPAALDRAKVTIEVQNGTGITGEAAYLQTQLKNLGYSNITVGNASSQNASTTTVTFSKTLASGAVDEITKKLEELYKTVEAKTSTSLKTDVLIVTGLRKGATAKPSASPTPKSTGTPKATTTSSPTGSPTASPTATPST